MKKAIVTGATGFIGRSLIAELISEEIFVFAIVRPDSLNTSLLPESPLLSVIECDLNNISNLPELISDRDIDVFYHLAWEGVSGQYQSDYPAQLRNIEYTLNATETLPIFGIKKFISTGSLHESECIIEMSNSEINTNLGIMYKAAKLAAHYMARVKVCALDIDFIWPIIINAYGVGELSPRLVNSTIRKILQNEPVHFTEGKQLYDFVYITDVAIALRLLGEHGKSCVQYNIGSGKPKPLREYLEIIGQRTDPNVPLKFGTHKSKPVFLPIKHFDTTTLKSDTGFVNKITFEEGIDLTHAWIKNQRRTI